MTAKSQNQLINEAKRKLQQKYLEVQYVFVYTYHICTEIFLALIKFSLH